jgi:mannosyltransferase OCH1-like enzyme
LLLKGAAIGDLIHWTWKGLAMPLKGKLGKNNQGCIVNFFDYEYEAKIGQDLAIVQGTYVEQSL